MKAHLQSQYKDIAERIISMALESVDYSEDKACRILDIVTQEDKDKVKDSKKKSDKKKGKDGDAAEKNVSFKENRYQLHFKRFSIISNVINNDIILIYFPLIQNFIIFFNV